MSPEQVAELNNVGLAMMVALFAPLVGMLCVAVYQFIVAGRE